MTFYRGKEDSEWENEEEKMRRKRRRGWGGGGRGGGGGGGGEGGSEGRPKQREEEQEEEFFFAKILKMIKYTSLPNLVRLAQWEQVSEYILLLLLPGIIKARTNPVRLRIYCS